MKRMTFLGVTVLAAGLAFAQGPGGPRPGRPDRTPPDPAQMIAARVNMLAKWLDLTDDQKAQATKIFTDAQTAGQATRTAMQDARTALTAAVKSNNLSGIEQAAAAAGNATAQSMSVEGKAQAAFYAILTVDQKAKYDQRPEPGGPGGPMGGFGRMRGGPPAR